MPRLFVGLDLSHECRQVLADVGHGIEGARWLAPQDFHITLRFIGDVDRHTGDEIASELARLVYPRFEIGFGHLDVFGGKNPRSLFATINPNPALTGLQQKITARVGRILPGRDSRKFIPHVTLARLTSVPAAEIARYLTTRRATVPPAMPVEQFILYSARESVGGGPYLAEAIYRLRPSLGEQAI